MLRYLPLLLVLMGFEAMGQRNITLLEKGDSSIYLQAVNDTLSYLTFSDPDDINKSMREMMVGRGFSDLEPLRSGLLLARYLKNDTLFLEEIFTKRYLNPSVEYLTGKWLPEDKLHILFEGQRLPGGDFLNGFDSLFVQVGDSSYLGDLNTSIYHFILPRRGKGTFDVRIYDTQGRVDYTMPVSLNKNDDCIFLKFTKVESELTSFSYQEYLQNHIPRVVKTKDGAYPLNIRFVDWMHHWKTKEIRYYDALLLL